MKPLHSYLVLGAGRQGTAAAIEADCGMGPGMGNNLAVYAMSLLDQPEHVMIYDAGLPQEPQPPWNYLATFNETTGFTAMERSTGWHASIVAAMLARDEIAPGATPLEVAVPAGIFVEQARRRGFAITERIE